MQPTTPSIPLDPAETALSRWQRPVLVVVLAVLLICVSLLVMDSEGEPKGPSTGEGNALSRNEVEARLVSLGLRQLKQPANQNLPPLAVTKGRPEPMPAAMRGAVENTIGLAPELHLRFARSQLIRAPGGQDLWLVEGRGVTCLFRAGVGTSTCQTTAATRQGGAQIAVSLPPRAGSSQPSGFLLVGVAPNWARAIRVLIGNQRVYVPIHHHVYEARRTNPIRPGPLVRVTNGTADQIARDAIERRRAQQREKQ